MAKEIDRVRAQSALAVIKQHPGLGADVLLQAGVGRDRLGLQAAESVGRGGADPEARDEGRGEHDGGDPDEHLEQRAHEAERHERERPEPQRQERQPHGLGAGDTGLVDERGVVAVVEVVVVVDVVVDVVIHVVVDIVIHVVADVVIGVVVVPAERAMTSRSVGTLTVTKS